MAPPKVSRMELQLLEILWSRGPSSIRELQAALPPRGRGMPPPAYTTVQTLVYRLEWKKAIRRVGKTTNAHIFAAAISRAAVRRRLVDDLLGLFGGSAVPVLAHLIDSGKLTREELREAQKAFRERTTRGEP